MTDRDRGIRAIETHWRGHRFRSRAEAAHLRGMIEARERHVAGPTRIAWGHKAERCEDLAGRIGKGEQTTVFRFRGGR